ncbi:pentatricopeptide repeat-containing protein At1g62350-like [Selaginella moellendorffii]|uniref:pentatricopeptide repeat-containing protein At1g62350-like n=1 Tax=Selaginella moellendorffii TaxID=88036 RepID=UPI000D1CD7A7|nr:pentatricopeptide repeat-containing protein At1g62350-like [Selaginella moellendorffii]|eukprot:XP_024539219.1 pentatricopeptide repeat-containing protein At1g62350-like [Selaginella moellendorffii]
MGSVGLPSSPVALRGDGKLPEQCSAIGVRFRSSAFVGIEIAQRGDLLIARGGRKSLVRETVTSGSPLSKEGITVVQALKGAKNDQEELRRVFATQVCRLLKRDLLEVLKELERQNECDLALKIFEAIRREEWFKPDFRLYRRMFGVMWENNRVDDMVYVYEQVKRDGMEPDFFLHRELMVAHLKHGNPVAAMELYEQAKGMKFQLNEKTYGLVIRELQGCGKIELAAAVEEDLGRAFPKICRT